MNQDLRSDPAARPYIKVAEVDVIFADSSGHLQTIEGRVSYSAGDAILTGVQGEEWPVAREAFEASYEPVPPTVAGKSGRYSKKPRIVWAKQMPQDFTVLVGRCRDEISGNAGDWLTQYDPGDFGVVSNEIFQQTYQLAETIKKHRPEGRI